MTSRAFQDSSKPVEGSSKKPGIHRTKRWPRPFTRQEREFVERRKLLTSSTCQITVRIIMSNYSKTSPVSYLLTAVFAFCVYSCDERERDGERGLGGAGHQHMMPGDFLDCSADVAGTSMDDFESCGGDITGLWRNTCSVFYQSVSVSGCRLRIESRSQGQLGTMEFSSEGVVRRGEYEFDVVVAEVRPAECVDACDGENCDELSTGECSCEEYSGKLEGSGSSAVYSTEGGVLKMGPLEYEYCVKGEALQLRRKVPGAGLIVDGYARE